jgi:hypothetical protein
MLFIETVLASAKSRQKWIAFKKAYGNKKI